MNKKSINTKKKRNDRRGSQKEYFVQIWKSYSRQIFKYRKVLARWHNGRNEMAMLQVNNKWENNICIIYLGVSERARDIYRTRQRENK